jgi:hypothetical protein
MDTLTDPVFRTDGAAFIPGDAAVGPWSADALQGSATAALAVRTIEMHPSAEGRQVARLGFDFWRPAGRAPIELAFSVLRDGAKARTVALDLVQQGVSVMC